MSRPPLLLQLWISDGIRPAHQLLLECATAEPSAAARWPLRRLRPRWGGPQRPVWIRLDLLWPVGSPSARAAAWESWLRQEVLQPLGIAPQQKLQQVSGPQGLRLWMNRIPEAAGGREALRAWILRQQRGDGQRRPGSASEQLRWLLCLLQLERHPSSRSGAAWPAAMALARELLAQTIQPPQPLQGEAAQGLLLAPEGQPLRGASAQLLVALTAMASLRQPALFQQERQALRLCLGPLSGDAVADWRTPQLLAEALAPATECPTEAALDAALLAKTAELAHCPRRRSSARLWLLTALATRQPPAALAQKLNPLLSGLLRPLQGGSRRAALALGACWQPELLSGEARRQALRLALAEQCQPFEAIRWPDPQAALGGWPPPAALGRRCSTRPWRAPLLPLIALQHLEGP